MPDARRTRELGAAPAASVRAGDDIYCPRCARWEHVTRALPSARGRTFIRTDHHDAFKLRTAPVAIRRRPRTPHSGTPRA